MELNVLSPSCWVKATGCFQKNRRGIWPSPLNPILGIGPGLIRPTGQLVESVTAPVIEYTCLPNFPNGYYYPDKLVINRVLKPTEMASLISVSRPVVGLEEVVASLRNTFQDRKVICLGDRHTATWQPLFGAQVIASIEGFTHLVLEIKTHHQWILDKFAETGDVDCFLNELKERDYSFEDSYVEMCLVARNRGIRLLASDVRGYIDEGGRAEEDLKTFDFIDKEVKRYELTSGKDCKILVYYGSGHIAANNSPFCLGKLLRERYNAGLVLMSSFVQQGRGIKCGLEPIQACICAAGLGDQVLGFFDLELSVGDLLYNDHRINPANILRNDFDAVVYIPNQTHQ